MNITLMIIDAILCGLIALAAVEYLRAVDVFKHPVLAAAFYLVAIGSFGMLIEVLRVGGASIFSVTMHLGVVVYAWARRQYIFPHEWSGVERRGGYQPVSRGCRVKAPPRNP